MRLRFVTLVVVLVGAGCPRREATPPAAPATSPRVPAPQPESPRTCEALATFHESARSPNAFVLATVRTKHRDCTQGPCQTRLDVRPFHALRGPEFDVTEGGLPHAAAERLTNRPDDYVLIAAHVDPEGVELAWAYPLYYAAEGERMLALYESGECPPVRLPRDRACADCQPDDCATGCCRWEDFGCGPAETCTRLNECEPKCCG